MFLVYILHINALLTDVEMELPYSLPLLLLLKGIQLTEIDAGQVNKKTTCIIGEYLELQTDNLFVIWLQLPFFLERFDNSC